MRCVITLSKWNVNFFVAFKLMQLSFTIMVSYINIVSYTKFVISTCLIFLNWKFV